MKQLFSITFLSLACGAIALAGTESYSGKEMKQVAPAPPPLCDWTGFYIGVHAGGQFGHSETNDLDDWNFTAHHHFGYDEDGFNGGLTLGYNWQWHWLVTGPEFDIGYMNVQGHGTEPGSPGGDSRGETDSDFYTSLRGRIGVTLGDCWLIYATGGGIGLNTTNRFIDDCRTGNCGGGILIATDNDFNWGWTIGGGIEKKFGQRWSIKAEYLYFNVDDEHFSGVEHGSGTTWNFDAETAGHIVRAGLNFHF